MATDRTLYERLGGREAIAAVVDEFYDRVVADDRLRPHFEDTDMQRLRAHQTQFLVAAADGPQEYAGESVRAAHDDLDLSEDDFWVVADHLDAALAACDVPDREREQVMSTVAGLEADVLGG
jgi:hemoglobin